ncbi:UNVERIFIED_ORG: hypothetical protein BDU10_2528 [Burkholderia sp. CF145]
MRAFSLSVIMLCTLPVMAAAGESSAIEIVPGGMYVHTENPECGVPSTFAESLAQPAIIEAVTKTFGVQAGAALIVVTEADRLAKNNGGELGKLWNEAAGRRDGASCVTFCVRTPIGAKPTDVKLSDRHGKTKYTLPFKQEVLLDNATTYDWSGWRDVVSAQSDGRTYVCATATNWQAGKSSTAIKRLAIDYQDVARDKKTTNEQP